MLLQIISSVESHKGIIAVFNCESNDPLTLSGRYHRLIQCPCYLTCFDGIIWRYLGKIDERKIQYQNKNSANKKRASEKNVCHSLVQLYSSSSMQ